MERAIVEYEAGDLLPVEAEAFARLADRGVADVESLVDSSLPDWARRRGRLRFVVSSRVQISRTHDRVVYLPLERVRTRSAPYLHETVHALVPSRGNRTWLSEGLACYLESYVSETLGGYDAHVFSRAGNRGIHAAARRTLAGETGRAVLPWVGRLRRSSADGGRPRGRGAALLRPVAFAHEAPRGVGRARGSGERPRFRDAETRSSTPPGGRARTGSGTGWPFSADRPYFICGKPRFTPRCWGSGQRLVTTLPRV